MKISKDLILTVDNIKLIPFHTTDVDNKYIVEIANDYNIAKFIGHRFPHPYDVSKAEEFKKYAKKSWEKGTEFVFGIFVDGEYVGNIGITPDDKNNIISNLGYWLGKKYEGKGTMSKSVKLMIDYCFNELKVRKIEAGFFEGNIGSEKVLTKNGFLIVGKLFKHQKLEDGTLLDDFKCELMNPDFS